MTATAVVRMESAEADTFLIDRMWRSLNLRHPFSLDRKAVKTSLLVGLLRFCLVVLSSGWTCLGFSCRIVCLVVLSSGRPLSVCLLVLFVLSSSWPSYGLSSRQVDLVWECLLGLIF